MPELTLTQISGIGPATARVLTENGFATVEAVATATSAGLARVPGFGSARAAVVIAAAKSLLSQGEASKPARRETAVDKKKGKKKKGKKKKDKKGKDKKGKDKKKKKDKKKRNK